MGWTHQELRFLLLFHDEGPQSRPARALGEEQAGVDHKDPVEMLLDE